MKFACRICLEKFLSDILFFLHVNKIIRSSFRRSCYSLYMFRFPKFRNLQEFIKIFGAHFIKSRFVQHMATSRLLIVVLILGAALWWLYRRGYLQPPQPQQQSQPSATTRPVPVPSVVGASATTRPVPVPSVVSASATTRPVPVPSQSATASSPAQTNPITHTNCLQVALQLLQNSGREPRRDGKSFRTLIDHAGGWAQVPSGCSVASGRGSWVVHWNERKGINQMGGWTRVCPGPRLAAEGQSC